MYRRPHGTPWAQGQSLAGADGPGWMVDRRQGVRAMVCGQWCFQKASDVFFTTRWKQCHIINMKI